MSKKVRSHGGLELPGQASIDGLEIESMINLPSTMGKGRILNISGRLNFATDNSVSGSNVQQIAYLSDIPVAINGKDGSKIIPVSGVPSNAIGVQNDIAIDNVSSDWYLKGASTWAKQGNLRGLPGTNGTNGAQIIPVAGVPGNALGANGDLAIDSLSSDWYSKTGGAWSKQGNLKGTNGINGTNGSTLLILTTDPVPANGVNGDSAINTTSGDVFFKAGGTWSRSGNIKGPKGDSLGVILKSFYGQTGVISGTTIITSKDSVPLISEGTEVWRFTYQASEMNSLLTVDFAGVADCIKRNCKLFFVLFRDNNVIDWGSITTNSSTVGSPMSFLFRHMFRNTDLNQHTYILRVGSDSATTWYLGRGNDKNMGNINECYYSYQETRTT